MKRDTVKQVGHRMLALMLASVLLIQAASPVAARAAEIGNIADELIYSDVVPGTTDPVGGETNTETQAVEPTQEETIPETEGVEQEETIPEISETAPHDLLAAAETGRVEVTSADQLTNGIPVGSTYVLTKDIAMGADQQIGVIAGIFDGAGHTVTLNGKPLVRELTGTIQNLMVAGRASLQNDEGTIACTVKGGSILNSCSTVTNNIVGFGGMGGLVGYAENAKIYNSYFAGIGKDEFGITSISGIVGKAPNANAPSQLKNCYYAEGTNIANGEGWNRDDKSNGKKPLNDMKAPEFVELLNKNMKDKGYVWTGAEGGLPVLAAKNSGGQSNNPQIKTAADLPNEIPAGVTYELAADITLNADQQIALLAGTLNGKGHIITLNGKPLVRELRGTVKNLMVAGRASLQNDEGTIACTVKGGSILNSCSTVTNNIVGFGGMGGLVGYAENAKIYNSYFAGTGKDEFGITSISGIVGKAPNANAPSQLKNCYYAEGTNIANGEGWNRDDKSNGKKSLNDMKTPGFVELLNATQLSTGYIWTAVEGALPKLIPGGGELKPCNKEALEAAIQEAEGKQHEDYTNETWEPMQEALKAAKQLNDKIDATQEEVDKATKTLQDAIAALKEKVRDLSPVEPPKEGVILISGQQDFSKIDSKDSTKFYQLTKDIVITGDFRARDLAGVFDGNGHTITLRTASPIFTNILETAVVQNLRIKVEGNFTNRQEFAPYAEKLRGGIIVNCISEVTGQHSAGFVRKMEDGFMVNCLTMGHNRRGAFVYYQKSTDHQNKNGYKSGKFHNCYWSASNSVENITPVENLINCAPVGDKMLRSDEFINKVNGQKGQFGATWGRDTNGYPYFGTDHGDHVIDGSKNRYTVEFVWRDNQVLDITNGLLEVSPQMTDSARFAGTFRMQGVPADSTITWTCDDRADRNIMQLDEDLKLHVFQDGGAVVRAVEHKADGTEELAAEIRVVSASREIQELRLMLDDKVIENTATVQGSSNNRLQIQARYVGAEDFETIPSYLVRLDPEKPDMIRTDYNTATFRFAKPGTSKLTVTEKTEKQNPVSVTVTLTSEYVPVKSVRPAISGTEYIHYRNSMGSGQFISIPQTIFVEPSNASYKNDVIITSSDPSIADYGDASYTPYKNGTVTFTAKINDNGKIVEGKSEVTFVYQNPLTEVTGPQETITLNQGDKLILPLTFKGQPGSRHEITEPDLNWTFDQKEIVSIQRPDALMQIRDTGGPDDGNWVASTKFEVKGLRPGTVVATGTPVDTTSGAMPVQITITVTGDGGDIVGFDIPKFIKEGKEAATAYLNAHNSFSFGEEWAIFTLLRDGQTLPQDKLNKYYDDVVTNVHSWKSNILATEVERTAMALNIMGKDITNVDGVNLVKMICNHPNLTKQGSNSLAWALIALDMNNTEIPADMKWSRDRMVSELLKYQNKDGGFGLDKTGTSGVDMTAMSLQALARYQDRSDVAAAIERGVGYLAAAVEKNLNLGNAESIAQVVITLSVLNRDLVHEPGFGDEMDNLMSVLADYMVAGKGFKHSQNGDVDKMASAQSMQAICAYERFLKGESGYWDLKGTGPVQDPAQKVSNMIAALPEHIGAADAEAVKAARAAYNALTDAQKQRVTNLDKLIKAEKALEELLAVQQVIDAIAALPEELTLADAHAVKQARNAYELLSTEQKAQVTNIRKLEAAEAALKELANPEAVMNMIDALPEKITLKDKNAVQAARAAYDLLKKEQQEMVTNLHKLEKAEQQLDELESAQKVQKVVEAIKALPEKITLGDEKAVQAARAAYNQLTDTQKAQVSNYEKLLKAEKAIVDQKAAAKVENAIEALPEPVTIADEQAVKDARQAYDSLSADQKDLVKNLEKLTDAETHLENLIAAQKIMAMIKDLPVDITTGDEQRVLAARSAYDALTAEQQKLVMNLYILERAEQVLAEQKAVQAVEDAINALPKKITEKDADAIKAARAAYNHLSPELRKMVNNLDKLKRAEKALQAMRKPGGTHGTESNVVEAVVENGKVSAKQLADIQGKDMILRIKGTMETGEEYVLSIYGKDVAQAVDFSAGLMRKGQYEKEILKLAENPEIFRFQDNGPFPGPMMVEMATELEDGDYLLLRYDPNQQRAALVSRVQAADGKLQFIVEEGGEYFLAKRASSKSIAELEKVTEEPTEPQQQTPDVTEATQPAPQEQKNSTNVLIWLPLAVLVVAVVALALKKRKEK